MPIISVCIPTYNESKYIIDTLVSLAKQTLFSQSEIVIADYDPEGTKATFNTVAMGLRTMPVFAGKIKWVNVFKSGIGIARHIACTQANGLYLISFDADANFEKYDAFANLIKPFDDPGVKLVHCLNEIKPDERSHPKAESANTLYKIRSQFQAVGVPFPYEPGLTMRKKDYLEVGGFRDVVMCEGPLLGFDTTLKFGLGCVRHTSEVNVLVSGRRAVGSGEIWDLNYNKAYR